jgi:hypothetical protein
VLEPKAKVVRTSNTLVADASPLGSKAKVVRASKQVADTSPLELKGKVVRASGIQVAEGVSSS